MDKLWVSVLCLCGLLITGPALNAQLDSALLWINQEGFTCDSTMLQPTDEFVILEREPVWQNIEALRNQIKNPCETEGKVIFRILVNKEGKVEAYKSIVNHNPTLETKLTAIVPKISFSPAIRAGQPVCCWVTIPFSYCCRR